jgi:hypothetical protein
MKTRAETRTLDSGARIEVGIVEFEGREFSAFGSVVDAERGVVCGYPKRAESGWSLTAWGGATMAKLTHVNAWRQRGFHGVTNTIHAWRATVDGAVYVGRNSGEHMFLCLRKVKSNDPKKG